jgi:hypothetical protein
VPAVIVLRLVALETIGAGEASGRFRNLWLRGTVAAAVTAISDG